MTETDVLFAYFIFACVLAGFTAAVAARKGRSGLGWFLLGLLLPGLALIAALVLSTPPAIAESEALAKGDLKTCPQCAEPIRKDAIVCRYCGASQAT